MTLYRVAENADAIKSLVVHIFHLTGIWGLTHATWGDFCDQVLHTHVRRAYRLANEGAIARKLLSGDPFLKTIIVQLKSTALQKNDDLCQNVTPFSDLIENLPPVNSRHATIARDRKLLRIIQVAPEAQWVEIADEAALDGKPTPQSVRAAVAKVTGKHKKTETSKPEGTEPPLPKAVQDALDAAKRFENLALAIGKAAGELERLAGEAFGRYIEPGQPWNSLKRIAGMIRQARPYAECHHCQAKGCGACNNNGWLRKVDAKG
jgi:hypothetical protein